MTAKKSSGGIRPSIISYITIVGWLVAYFVFPSSPRTTLELYHMRQSLGLHLTMFVLFLVFGVFPFLDHLTWIVQAVYLVAIILGILAAKSGDTSGSYGGLSAHFQDWFQGLK